MKNVKLRKKLFLYVFRSFYIFRSIRAAISNCGTPKLFYDIFWIYIKYQLNEMRSWWYVLQKIQGWTFTFGALWFYVLICGAFKNYAENTPKVFILAPGSTKQKDKQWSGTDTIGSHILPSKPKKTTKYINWQQFTKGTRGKPNEQLFFRQVVIELSKLY